MSHAYRKFHWQNKTSRVLVDLINFVTWNVTRLLFSIFVVAQTPVYFSDLFWEIIVFRLLWITSTFITFTKKLWLALSIKACVLDWSSMCSVWFDLRRRSCPPSLQSSTMVCRGKLPSVFPRSIISLPRCECKKSRSALRYLVQCYSDSFSRYLQLKFAWHALDTTSAQALDFPQSSVCFFVISSIDTGSLRIASSKPTWESILARGAIR